MDTASRFTLASWGTSTIPTSSLTCGHKIEWDTRTLCSPSTSEPCAPNLTAPTSTLELNLARPPTTNVLTPAERAALRFSDNKAARLLDVAIVRDDPLPHSPFGSSTSLEEAQGEEEGSGAKTLKRLRSLFALDVPMPIAKRQKQTCHSELSVSVADRAEGEKTKTRVVLPSLVDEQGGSAVSERQRRLIARAQKKRGWEKERGEGGRKASVSSGAGTVRVGDMTRRAGEGGKAVVQGFIPVFSVVESVVETR